MTVRDKLIEILDRNCGYTEEERAEVVADRLINSGLIKDDKVYKPIYKHEENIVVDGKIKWTAYCSKYGEWLTDIFIARNRKDFDNYCYNCGAKLKELQNER